MAWGRPRSCTCGACAKCKRADYMREWYRSKSLEERRAMREQRDPERVREADRRRYHEQQKNDPDAMKRRQAVSLVNNAIRDGRLQRQPCEVCGDPAQAHHDDYSKPLDVRWLCTTHHANHHMREAA